MKGADQSGSVADRRKPAQPLWLRRSLFFLPAIGMALGFYWWLSFTGLYRWLILLQLQHFGRYYEQVTVMVTVLIPTFALMWLPGLLQRLGVIGPAKASSDVEPIPLWDRESWLSKEFWTPVQRIRVALGFALVIPVGTYVAVYPFGEHVSVDVEALEKGERPKSRHLTIRGVPLDSHRWFGEFKRPRYFVPIVSGHWRQGQPITVFLEMSKETFQEGRWERGEQGQFEATRSRLRMHPLVQEGFAEMGLVPAEKHVLLNYPYRNPEHLQQLPMLFLPAGIVGFFGWLWLRFATYGAHNTRKLITELLELVANPNRVMQSNRKGPPVMWPHAFVSDWKALYQPQEKWFQSAYSAMEQETLAAFDTYVSRLSSNMPQGDANAAAFLQSPAGREATNAAQAALYVLRRR
jgi:hypothetical protein